MKNSNKKGILAILIITLILGTFPAFSTTKAEGLCLNLPATLWAGNTKTSKDVVTLQTFLNAKGYLQVAPTGYFGSLTLKAVKKFQTENNITSNGIVGPLTRGKIKSLSCEKKEVSKPVTAVTLPASTTTPVITPVAPAPSKALTLPVSSSDFSNWEARWGNVSTTTEGLVINASETTYGSQAIFSPGLNLTDYKYTASIIVKQGTVVLIARYVNDDNFVACTFGGRTVEIIQRKAGVSQTVASGYVTDTPYTNYFYVDLSLSMNVKGNVVGCVLTGPENNVTFSNIDPSLSKGSVGVQTWAGSLGVAKATLRQVSIEAI